MNVKFLNRCPNCGCRELEELESDYNGADGIQVLMSCMDCNFKATLHFGYSGWTSEDSDAESDEQI